MGCISSFFFFSNARVLTAMTASSRSPPLSFPQATVRAQRKVTTAALSEPAEIMVRLLPIPNKPAWRGIANTKNTKNVTHDTTTPLMQTPKISPQK